MPPRSDLVLFLDLEATGSDNTVDEIVQIGVVALAAPSWAEVAAFDHCVLPSDAGWTRMMENDVVREMHEKSGLLSWLRQAKANFPELATPAVVENNLIEWLIEVGGPDTSHIPYGGNGVSHYDRPFIKRQMPRFNRRITYWALDVGPARRMAEMAGRTDWPKQDEAKQHDAIEDARFHAREFRFALQLLKPNRHVRGPWAEVDHLNVLD